MSRLVLNKIPLYHPFSLPFPFAGEVYALKLKDDVCVCDVVVVSKNTHQHYQKVSR